jgi:hypothetical protein
MLQEQGLDTISTARYVFKLNGGDEVTLYLPLVNQLEATTLIHHLPDFGPITLGIGYRDFSVIGRHLKGGVTERTELEDEEAFIRACDYLGLGGLFERVTRNAARVYEGAITSQLLLERTREAVVRRQHLARMRGEGPPPIDDMARMAKLGERYCPEKGESGFCEMIESVHMGSVIFELPPGYSTPLTAQEFASRYKFPVIDPLGPIRPEWVEDPAQIVATLNEELPNFPWQDLVLAGSSILSAAVTPSMRHLYHNRDYDFFVTAGSQRKGRIAIRRVAAWIESVYGQCFMIAATEQAVSFFTENAVYQIVLRLYGTPEPDDSDEAPTVYLDRLYAIEHVLTGFDLAPCSLGFDGAQIWAIPRAVEAIRSNVIPADPWLESENMVPRLLKYASRRFSVGFPGLTWETYERLMSMRGVRGASFGRTIVEQFIGGKCEKVSGDYSPVFHPINMKVTQWADRERRFHWFINDMASRFFHGRNGTIRVFTRQIDAVLNTPAGVPADALAALVHISHPDSVYVASNAPASDVVFIWQHGHTQKHALSGSFKPCASPWFPEH